MTKTTGKIMRGYRKRLRRVLEAAQTHCGEEGAVVGFKRKREELEWWLAEEIDRLIWKGGGE